MNYKYAAHLIANAGVSMLVGYAIIKIGSVIGAVALMSMMMTWFCLYPRNK